MYQIKGLLDTAWLYLFCFIQNKNVFYQLRLKQSNALFMLRALDWAVAYESPRFHLKYLQSNQA